MPDHSKVAIFWDYENCSPPSSSSGLGYDIVNNISRVARLFGSVTTFRAYLDISAQSSKSVALRSELQSSGVSMIDCPHNGRKDVVDKMILVDMLAFAVDHPAPATIILIAGDRDYAYAVSTLKLRKYQIVLVVPSSPHTSPSLESQASVVINWGAAALRTRAEAANSTQSVRQPYVELDVNLVTSLLRELQDAPLDDPNTIVHPNSTSSPNTPSLRRVTTRDLLEPSTHHKNTRSLDSTQDSTTTLASPRKSTSAESDPAPGGLPIPKTPLRSRRVSVSAGSTQRSTTIVEQPPPAVGQDTLANLPPSSAGRSSISDVTDVGGPTPSVLPSLDTLELPLHDSCPPSSIIVRSPLQSSQSIPVSEEPTTSSHKFNCLASPFVLTKAPAASGSIPNSCAKQPYTAAGSTSPIVPATKVLAEAVTNGCKSPQKKGVGAPRENERVIGLRNDDSDTRSRPSIPCPSRANEVTWDFPCAPRSTYPSYVAPHCANEVTWDVVPHTTYSPSSASVELQLTDTSSSKRASPVATSLRVGDSIDSPPAAFPRASNALGCSAPSDPESSSSSNFPSTPPTATELHGRDENGRSQAWTMFGLLIHLLLAARERGVARPSRSTIAVDLVQSDKLVYRRAGVSKFRDYTALAEQAGIIELGGREADAWIALHPNWFGVNDNNFNTTTHFTPNSASSSSPLLVGRKTPLTERATVFQSPTCASPKFNSPENSSTRLTSLTDREDGTPWAPIPAQFQPLIDILIRTRAEGSHQTFRSVVGQLLGQDVYACAGVSGFKEYVRQAWEAQLVQLGGVGGHAWICLHPDLRI